MQQQAGVRIDAGSLAGRPRALEVAIVLLIVGELLLSLVRRG